MRYLFFLVIVVLSLFFYDCNTCKIRTVYISNKWTLESDTVWYNGKIKYIYPVRYWIEYRTGYLLKDKYDLQVDKKYYDRIKINDALKMNCNDN